MRCLTQGSKGVVLAESVAAVVVVAISLTLVAQSLFTNLRAATRFQDTVLGLMALENQLALLYATNGSQEFLSSRQDLAPPYERFTISGNIQQSSANLKLAQLDLQWTNRKKTYGLDASTLLYVPPAPQSP